MLALRFISVFVGARRASFPRDKRRETHDERNASRNFSFAPKAFFKLISYQIPSFRKNILWNFPFPNGTNRQNYGKAQYCLITKLPTDYEIMIAKTLRLYLLYILIIKLSVKKKLSFVKTQLNATQMNRSVQRVSWFAALLCLALLWTTPLMGQDYYLEIANVKVTGDNCNALSQISGVRVKTGGEFKYDFSTKTLTMKDVTVNCYEYECPIRSNVDGLTIKVSGTNFLFSNEQNALILYAPTSIEGDGILKASSRYSNGVEMSAQLTVSDITFEANGDTYGIMGNKDKKPSLSLKNAKVEACGWTAIRYVALKTVGCSIIMPIGGRYNEKWGSVENTKGGSVGRVRIGTANEYIFTIAGTQVTAANCNDLSQIDGVTVAKGGEFKYDFSTNTLTMKDVTIDTPNYGIESEIPIKISVSGQNNSLGSALRFHAATLIEGNGFLKGGNILVTGEKLTLSDVTLESYSITGDYADLVIKNAVITTTGAIQRWRSFTTDDCTILNGWYSKKESAILEWYSDDKIAKNVTIGPKKGFFIAGILHRDINYDDLSKIHGVTVAKGGVFKYNADTKTLTMKDVTISNEGYENFYYSIENYGIEHLKIEVSGTNVLKNVLYLHKYTEIKGSGLLKITDEHYPAIYVVEKNASLRITDVTLEAHGDQFGIYGGSTLLIDNASVVASSKRYDNDAAIGGMSGFSTQNCGIFEPRNGFWNKESKSVDYQAPSRLYISARYVRIEKYWSDLYIAGEQVNWTKSLKNIKGVTLGDGGEFAYDVHYKTLTMKNVTVTAGDGVNAIENRGIDGLRIKISGTNQLNATNSAALMLGKSTTIEGDGKLVATSNTDAGVYLNNTSLSVSKNTLEASGKWGITGPSTASESKLLLREVTLTAKGSEGGICNLAEFYMAENKIVTPASGKFNETKYAIVDATENVAREVNIVPTIKYDLYINDTQVDDVNCSDLTKIKGVEVKKGGECKFDSAAKTLIMKDVKLNLGIHNRGIDGLRIMVSGENEIGFTIELYASTFIEGNGTIDLEYHSIRIGKNTTLSISDITLSADGYIRGFYDGKDGKTLIIKNANIKVKKIEQLTSCTIEDCEIVAPRGARFDETKHAVVDEDGNVAENVIIMTDPVAVTGITLSPTTVDLRVGETQALTISVQSPDATEKHCYWKSDNEDVAKLDNYGVITAEGVGTATITITTVDGEKTASCTVNVFDENGELPLNSLSLDHTELRVEVNKAEQLNVVYKPSATTQKGVWWTSDDPKIAVVSDGWVKGITEGSTMITATSIAKPEERVSCYVTVIPSTAIEDSIFTSVVVAPNPFNAQLCISNGDVRGKYSLLNAQGLEVAFGALEGAETRINTTTLPSGVYLLRLTAENGATKTFTVVKR